MAAGILTFHRNNNPGSVMQAYCLSTFLGLPIVDFTYPNRLDAIKRLCRLPGDMACLEWSSKKLHTTKRLHKENEAIEYINSLDYVVIGSDEVWKHSNAQRSHLMCSYPNVYFGHNIKCKKIAYAAALGHKSTLGQNEIKHLDRFDLISVRDSATYDAIHNVSVELAARVQLVSDPTFSIEFFEPSKVKKGSRWLESDYGITYSLMQNPLNPIQWFEAVSALEFAFTRRMHGLIACLLGNTPVHVVCDRPKVKHLCDMFSLADGWPDQSDINNRIRKNREGHEHFRETIKAFIS